MVTLDTAYKCFAKLDIEPINGEFVLSCGSDVKTGCTISYTFSASDSCYYKIYDGSGNCVDEKVFEADAASGVPNSVRGGGFDVLAEYSRIVFSDKVSLSRSETHTVLAIISGIDGVAALLTKLIAYDIPSEDVQDIINLYLGNNISSSSCDIDIIDSLTSTSTEDGLSANQGNVLWNMIIDTKEELSADAITNLELEKLLK